MGLFSGAVFRHGGGARKQPIEQPTEMPTSTMALMGRFPSLMGRFATLMGRFTDCVLRGRFTSLKAPGKQPIKKRGIKRSSTGFRSARQVFCGDASRLFLDHFSKHLSSVLERTELCHEVRNPGPQNPKSSTIKTTTWHCLEVSGQVRPRQGTEICNFGAPSALEALH